ncbi:MAG: hypothetical protein H6843_07275 [Rhodospirillaceae bacterium]|nr:hypothetical protein [Rhodospirillaceae bacterium]
MIGGPLRSIALGAALLGAAACAQVRAPDSGVDPANQPITDTPRLLTTANDQAPSGALARTLPGLRGDPAATQVGGRVPVDPTVYPWSAIGRLDFVGAESCTGTLIGRREVLTTAYCIPQGLVGGTLGAGTITFTTGLTQSLANPDDESFVTRAHGRQVILAPGFRETREYRGSTVYNFVDNWALVILDEAPPVAPITWESLTPAEIAAMTPVGTVALVGYGPGRNHILSGDFNCRLAGTGGETGLTLQACDARVGDGGSPLLMETERGEWRVLMALGGPGTSGVMPEAPVRPNINGTGQVYEVDQPWFTF